jgi:Putative bacterial sensory transduction regulator
VEAGQLAGMLADLGVAAEPHGDAACAVQVPATRRGAIAVMLRVGERTLFLRAFYCRGPDREHERVYTRLLRKHLDMRDWRFALDDVGDLYLIAEAPLEGLSAGRIDDLLGALATYVDETWESVIRTGFDVPEGTVFAPPPGEA